MNDARLIEILGGFPKARIAVIGDFFLDKLLLVDRSLDEPSLETGLTAYQITGKCISPGAAGNVMSNLAALSIGRTYAVGVHGRDGEGWELRQGLQQRGVDTGWLIESPSVFTPTYIKPMFVAQSRQVEANRLDIRNHGVLPGELEIKIIDNLRAAAGKVDAIIVLDQVVERNTGIITDRVRREVASLGRSHPWLVLFADSRAHSMEFEDTIVKCNHLESARALRPDFAGEPCDALIRESALELARRTKKPAFVTCGAKGIYVADSGGAVVLVPAVPVEGPVDICGAGDAATSGIVSAMCCGASPTEAAIIGNLAASITIRQLGMTGTATREQIITQFAQINKVKEQDR